ncbi:MAG: hypothetical protein OXF67_02450 [Cyanobacteria bacterium MAG CAR4_bin_6]|nr:hypothetical protein [Cyanobacteria bacterium MAG CAR4_bin_6]
MPTLPPGLTEWLPTGAVIGSGMFLFGVVRADLKAMETRLREDMKAMEAHWRDELKASEARWREELKAMDARHREDMKVMDARQREDNKALNEKLDRLLEARFSNQPVVAPER